MINQDVVSLMATTDSVIAVVVAKEELKQAVADDLNSTHSSPCEWFVCDDDQSATRFLVIQMHVDPFEEIEIAQKSAEEHRRSATEEERPLPDGKFKKNFNC